MFTTRTTRELLFDLMEVIEQATFEHKDPGVLLRGKFSDELDSYDRAILQVRLWRLQERHD